ncbi:MAG: agmatinase [Halioglobus sp.]
MSKRSTGTSSEGSTSVPVDDQSLYANVFSFMGLPLSRDIASASGSQQRPLAGAVVMGIPYDLGTTGRAGARSGPSAIRAASANLRWEQQRWPWQFALRDRLDCIDYGDLQFSSGDSEDLIEQVAEHASAILAAGKTLVSLGGDHLVTLPLLRAHAATHGKLALIHFDAHTDTYDEHAKYDHGSMFYHAPKEGLIDPGSSVQIGIRTAYEPAEHPFLVIDADATSEQSADAIAASIRARVGERPAYLTFDIDCLDPAFAPGTGTPVVGGITSAKALQIVRKLTGLNIVGFDVVEVSPAYDREGITALAAATLALEFLHLCASKG